MIRLSPPAFSGSNDIKGLLTAVLRRRAAEWMGQDVLDVPAGNAAAAGAALTGKLSLATNRT